MADSGRILLTLGSVLLLGLAVDVLGRATALPRITLLMIAGVAIGPEALDLLPADSERWFPQIADITLLLIGFLLGGHLSREALAVTGREVLAISLSVILISILVVGGGLLALGVAMPLALVLAAIATATDPMATLDVLRQFRARGPFSDVLQEIVAIDDAWGLIAFSILLAIAVSLDGGQALPALLHGARELGGSLLLGGLLGVPVAWVSGRLQRGEPNLVEALGAVFVCGGLAAWLGVSPLLASMALGATVVNLASHHERPFHEIEGIEGPFMILFFVLIGAGLRFDTGMALFGLTAAYIALRTLARSVGALPGGLLVGAPVPRCRWMGLALLPQAGVATGMALVAGAALPPWRDTLLGVTILSTAFFELAGPVVTRSVLSHAGELGRAPVALDVPEED